MVPRDFDLGFYTDFYQLTMAQGYFCANKHTQDAHFDYYFRTLPFENGYAVFAGLSVALAAIQGTKFQPAHLHFLSKQGFKRDFLDYLHNFEFKGTIRAFPEGEIAFPNEPLVCVSGGLLECQLVETLLLNILNFHTLIATKAARIRQVAPDKTLLEFGLRRAQGLGGMWASRAAYIGGFDGSSNVLSGFLEEIPISGTHAHAWVSSFSDELSAFRAYAETYPEKTSLLIDTYDTLKSGLPNAIIVAKEMEVRGQNLHSVRLDSGDLAYLSQKARVALDEAGLNYVKIAATNDLDEKIIDSLARQNAPIDIYGVGTNLVTAKDCPALGGVYKLIEIDGVPKIKISENVIKITLPGRKQVWREYDENGNMLCDAIGLYNEPTPTHIYHSYISEKNRVFNATNAQLLHVDAMKNGVLTAPLEPIKAITDKVKYNLARLPVEHKRLDNPHVYKVGITAKLQSLRKGLLDGLKK